MQRIPLVRPDQGRLHVQRRRRPRPVLADEAPPRLVPPPYPPCKAAGTGGMNAAPAAAFGAAGSWNRSSHADSAA